MSRKRDTFTVDLFRDYQPAPVVDRFDHEEVKAYSLAGKLSKAVALTMEESGMTREELATAVSDVTKSPISKAMLDAYASQAREQHSISAVRLAALITITEDPRALNVLLEDAGFIVIPKKYEALLKRERARELREQLEREERAADAEWRAKR
ncbi:hypothetical protein ELI24_17155 [Rhizobium ruizarguesonis]|uniref:hypothetical protein n=1 Tax=Rhizobium TaxID=379 RepID=UPI000366CBDC|nr:MULTISPECIES: hypothetical protein [Rhizobium]QHW25851.1 hypothetical protein GYN07_16545 [Rhizobium leguminosarum bv. viciae 248]TAV99988.1 hypothetical protein ELI24_17155 [Rhizobium ruizarguesonis]